MDLYENEFGKFLRSKVVRASSSFAPSRAAFCLRLTSLGTVSLPVALRSSKQRSGWVCLRTLQIGEISEMVSRALFDLLWCICLSSLTRQLVVYPVAVFCLTNPRLPDHPIVMCSDGFVRLTGYPRNQIVGRNCRFLQGPSTDPKTVLALRTALEAGKPSCQVRSCPPARPRSCCVLRGFADRSRDTLVSIQILLNYKRNGEPFLNLLSIIPLRSRTGHVEYFLAGQVNVR